MGRELEKMVQMCDICQLHKKSQPAAPLTRDIAVFTPTPGLPHVTTPARKTGRSRVAPARQADYVMD